MMADCEKYSEMISCLVDGELSDDEREEVLAHLSSCDDCSSIFAAYKTITRVHSDTAAEPPAELLQNVMQKIREQDISDKARKKQTENQSRQPERPRKYRSLKNFASLAASLLLIFAAGTIFSLNSKQNAKPTLPASQPYGVDAELMPTLTEKEYDAIIIISGLLPEYFHNIEKEDVFGAGQAFRFEAHKDITARLKEDSDAVDYHWTDTCGETDISLVIWVP